MSSDSKKHQTDTSKLTRCKCGTIYNLLERNECPECGKAFSSSSDPALGFPSRETSSSPRASVSTKTIILTFLTLSVLLLVASYLGKADTNLEATARQPSDAPPPNEAPQTSAVDSRLPGIWAQQVGVEQWFIEIFPEGRYQFAAVGARGILEHRGTFSTSDSRWTLHSETMNWDDEGTYAVPSSSTFTMQGRLGTGQWRRSSETARSNAFEQFQSSRRGATGSFRQDNGILPPS